MQALGVERVLILGGEGAVSWNVESQIAGAFGADKVERLAGPNRYATAAAVATWGVEDWVCEWQGLALATGEDFPDALTGGALQAQYNSVMLLTASNSLPAETRAALEGCQDDVTWMAFLGGEGAISTGVRTEVENIMKD